MDEKTGGYGIRAVVRLTGLPAHTLRLWEERYGAIRVARSPGGHRVYSAADVERLTRLKRLVDQDHRISDLASLTDADLDARLATDTRPTADLSVPSRAAVFGDMLPAAISAAGLAASVRVKDHDWTRFQRACVAAQPDAILLELPEVNAGIVADIQALHSQCPQARLAAMFHFSRRADLNSLRDAGVHAVRAPASAAELWWIVQQMPRYPAPAEAVLPPPAMAAATEPPAPRHFDPGQLRRLSAHSSAIACECPAHLVSLVRSLNAFETYSADCEHSSPEDAALHAFLHRETARARAVMEAALLRVAEAEGIDY